VQKDGVYAVGRVGKSAGGEYIRGRGSVVTGWGRMGGRDADGERVEEKGKKKQLEGRTMDCSTGKEGRLNRMRIGIR
jgi:hypothetical protein